MYVYMCVHCIQANNVPPHILFIPYSTIGGKQCRGTLFSHANVHVSTAKFGRNTDMYGIYIASANELHTLTDVQHLI